MKRRSLQSLRTPSPFTAAEQWYAGAKGYGEGNLSADAVVTYAPWQESPISPKAESPKKEIMQQQYVESDSTSVYEDVSDGGVEDTNHQTRPHVQARELKNLGAMLQGETDARYDTAVEEITGAYVDDYNDEIVGRNEADDYESDASLYHDSYPVQLSHEDREDAFDYEHFFLHSAMGTIGQQRNGRRGSYSSEGSVETTRGPPATSTQVDVDERPGLGHLRNESAASVSTLATFATATEGFDDDDDDDHDNFAVQEAVVPVTKPRSVSPPRGTKRSTFGSPMTAFVNEQRSASPDKIQRSASAASGMRPNGHSRQTSSVSQGSVGTRRSFPLVNNPRSPQLSEANNAAKSTIEEQKSTSPVDLLQPDDQALIETVVAAVGKCVLGLQDAGPTSYDAKIWRRRLDAARRVLEGDQEVI
jgi:hypothetical protein